MLYKISRTFFLSDMLVAHVEHYSMFLLCGGLASCGNQLEINWSAGGTERRSNESRRLFQK